MGDRRTSVTEPMRNRKILRSHASKATPPNAKVLPRNSSEKEKACVEMKSIMKDWHKAVYHKSAFSISSDLAKSSGIEPENQTMCRICQSLEDSVENQQVTPCGCSGSLQYVHMQCLKQWRQTKKVKGGDVSKCELCKQSYNVKLLGSSDVPTDNILKLQEDLKQLVKSGIYLMLLIKSCKEDVANMQRSCESTNQNQQTIELTNQIQQGTNRNKTHERLTNPKMRHRKNLTNHIKPSNDSTNQIVSQPSTSSTACSSATSSSSEDNGDYVTRESLKRRSERMRPHR